VRGSSPALLPRAALALCPVRDPSHPGPTSPGACRCSSLGRSPHVIHCNHVAYACGEGLMRARAWGSGKGGSQGFQSRVFGTRFWRSLAHLGFRRRSPPGGARGVKGGRAAPPCINKTRPHLRRFLSLGSLRIPLPSHAPFLSSLRGSCSWELAQQGRQRQQVSSGGGPEESSAPRQGQGDGQHESLAHVLGA